MSYGQSSLQVGDALHIIKFPDLVRVSASRLQIQLVNGCLRIDGRNMPLLYRELLAGVLTTVHIGQVAPGVTVERIEVVDAFTGEKKLFDAGECCPVPQDLVLLETNAAKDYLARSSLSFFGRLGRHNTTFIIGFTDRSYRIKAVSGQEDLLASAVFASRFAPGAANVFTMLAPEYYLPWPEIYRHRVAIIEETDHRPQDWAGSDFVSALHLGSPLKTLNIGRLDQRPERPSSTPDL